MRPHASVLHLDLDAFFAAVEQRDKPSLAGRPVVVGGLGPRGVVATASYEARVFGIASAMSTAEARARCPQAAFLAGRFAVYRETSRAVMELLGEISPLVEPLSLDEAFVDLAAGEDFDPARVTELATRLREEVRRRTGGLTASIGIGSSKLVAKIASEIDKPDGLHIVAPGTELDFLAPLPAKAIPGVGPVTAARLHQMGLDTIGQVRAVEADELVRILGESSGRSLYRLVRAEDHRRVAEHRDTKSISVEDTFARDIAGRSELAQIADRQSRAVVRRLTNSGLSARTVTVKIRFHDFETHTRSATLPGPTDDPGVVSRTARRLLGQIDTSEGLRLLGVGLSGLTDWAQQELFGDEDDTLDEAPVERRESAPRWLPGLDVEHDSHGAGWIWGSGRGRVTVRFESRDSPAGPVRTFAIDDPALRLIDRRRSSSDPED